MTNSQKIRIIFIFYIPVQDNIHFPVIVALIQANCLALINNMSRSQSIPVPPKRALSSKPPIKGYQPSSYFGPSPSQTVLYKQGPKSQRSLDGSSVRSFNAVEGSSLRGSMASMNSGVSGFSRKSEKSVLSNYPQMMNKEIVKAAPVFDAESHKEERRSLNPPKIIDQKQVKKSRIEYYVDEDYFYSSQFKRNFVKGMLALARSKNIEDLSLLLKQVAPTIKVRSSETSIWVSAFLIIFRIQHKLRRIRANQQNITELIEDELIELMQQNKNMKKARLMKIVVYLFRQLPIHKTKVVQWFEDFVRKNRDRLVGIDLSRYVDIYTINPCPIDYERLSVLSKNSAIKSKQAQKQRQAERRQIQREIEKRSEVVAYQYEEPNQIPKQVQKEAIPIIPMKQLSVKQASVKQMKEVKQASIKQPAIKQRVMKSTPAQKVIQRSAPSPVVAPLNPPKQTYEIQVKNASSATPLIRNAQKQVVERNQMNINPSEPSPTLEELISRRMENNQFSEVQKSKPKQVMKSNPKKEQPMIKQLTKIGENISKNSEMIENIKKKDAELLEEPDPIQNVEPQKIALTQKIKRLAKDRHEELKSQANNPKQAPQQPNKNNESIEEEELLQNEQMQDINEQESYSGEDLDNDDDDSFVGVSDQDDEEFSDN